MDVSKLYKKVDETLKRKNYDFAIEILKNQILKYNPNDIKARKLLRATVIEKYKNKGYPSQGEIISKGMVPRIKMIIGKLIKKWDMVIDEAENFLLYDPKNVSALYALGEACTEAGYIDSAIAVFENLLANDPKNVKALKYLGNIYKDHKKDLEKAQQLYQRALKYAPTDAECEKMVKDLSAQITASTYGQAKSSHDLIKDKEKAKELEEDQAILRTEEDIKRAIERVKKKLEENPESKKDLKRLGELYQKLGRLDEAISAFEKALKLDPLSFDLKSKISECKIKKADNRIKAIKEKLKASPNNENLKKELIKAKKIKNKVEIEEYTIQVKSQPTNYELRFKLGVALFQGGRYDDAIAEFQHAQKDPRRKIQSCIYMGQAFTKKGEFDLAVEQFQAALNSVSSKDKQYKDILYYLGMAYETANNIPEAIETYMKIYKEDINFKDVKERLKRLRQKS